MYDNEPYPHPDFDFVPREKDEDLSEDDTDLDSEDDADLDADREDYVGFEPFGGENEDYLEGHDFEDDGRDDFDFDPAS